MQYGRVLAKVRRITMTQSMTMIINDTYAGNASGSVRV